MESHRHLFGSDPADTCEYNMEGWGLFLSSLNLDSFPLHEGLAVDVSTLSRKLRRKRAELALVWNWFSWYERNRRAFQGLSSCVQISATSAAAYYRVQTMQQLKHIVDVACILHL
ncbi:hypothetical protein Cni_G20891 [Canna indica]|uniref:Uncharacterized protein n=1 Tax=Canna indica TaxID=4628 RepID=A0AAQ3QGQ0_9LILI|nr:hypothetical protein Cni_G20891 [Canna indica]